jgi:hypothetical protein
MRVRNLGFGLVAALCAAAAVAAPASAATPTPAPTIDLSKVDAKKEVKDTILTSPPKVASISKAVARASFTDSTGAVIFIDSTVPGADLNAVAGVLNSTYHRSEISNVLVHVVTLAQIPAICGDPQALACYMPNRDGSGHGQLWFANDDSDWIHSLVHEYGHHTDNQIANIGQLHSFGIGQGCFVDSDGSRHWFFERILGENTTDEFSCNGTDWEHLLPELYAEDFVVLNGINNWQLSSAKPPTGTQLKAMKYDIDTPLFTARFKKTKKIKHHRTYWRTVTTPNISFLSVKVSAGSGRDFDVWVYPHKSNKLWSKAAHNGRKEVYLDVIAPGKWDVGVTAYKKTGNAKIDISVL